MKQLNDKELKKLYQAILKLNSLSECEAFFRDLCTISELNSMSERFLVVKLLQEKKSYRTISEITGASTATVTRVAHWLNHGEGGYRLILDRI